MAGKLMRKRYRRRRSADVMPYDPWANAKQGDLMVLSGELRRLEDGCNGFLYARLIKPPIEGAQAVIEGDEVFWEWKET